MIGSRGISLIEPRGAIIVEANNESRYPEWSPAITLGVSLERSKKTNIKLVTNQCDKSKHSSNSNGGRRNCHKETFTVVTMVLLLVDNATIELSD